MDTLTLRDQVRRKLKITSTTVLANSAILAQLNVYYFRMATKIAKINEDYFEAQKVKNNLVQNTALYALPTDCIKFKQLRLAYSTPSDEADYKIALLYDPTAVEDVQAQEENVSSSNPIVDITNISYRIKPTPTADVTNGRSLYYIARPSALVNTADVPLIPLDYHDVIADGAAAEIASWFELWDRAGKYGAKYAIGVTEMLEELTPRSLNPEERFRNPLEAGRRRHTTELWP